jgi:uncharacterized protein (TIRG00374 family)
VTEPNTQPHTDPADGPSKAKKLRSHIFTAVRVVVSFGLLAAVIYGMGAEETFGALRNADPFWIGIMFAFMFLEGIHGTYKWLILLRHTAPNVRFWPLFKIGYIGGFVGMFMPGAVGIELVRMYGLARHTSDLAAAFTSVLMDRIIGLTGLTLVVLIGVMLQTHAIIQGIEYFAIGSLALILAGWVAIMNPIFRRFTDWMLSPPIFSMVRDKQSKVYTSLDTYRGRPGLLAWGLIQSLAYNVVRVAVCYCGALAVGVNVPFTAMLLVVPLVIFVMLIPISIFGWGVREATFVAMLAPYGTDSASVIAMSILIGICGTISILPGGLFCMQGLGKARETTAHANVNELSAPEPVEVPTHMP